ncbi:MAG: type II secretion system protein [Nitrospirota bacterium]
MSERFAGDGSALRVRALRNQQGFTLVELVILLVIAAIVLPGLMVYFIESMQHSADAQIETVALGLAQELMEEVKAKRWDENSPIDPDNPQYSAIGPDAGETRCDPAAVGCTALDDIDDYHGLNNGPPNGPPNDLPQGPHGEPLAGFSAYRQTVSVCYVTAVPPVSEGGAGADAGACVAGPTDYKKITAAVYWDANQQHIQLETVVANYQVEAE